MHGICGWAGLREERGSATTHRENAMRKLALNVDALRVESFATQEMASGRGTVRGHDDTVETENCTLVRTCLITTCVSIKNCAAEGDNDAAENR
jgi:hypothetical protein